MKKVILLSLAAAFTTLLVAQANVVFAKTEKPGKTPKLTINTPITSGACKPGWGFGDKNHCHSGPPGLVRK